MICRVLHDDFIFTMDAQIAKHELGHLQGLDIGGMSELHLLFNNEVVALIPQCLVGIQNIDNVPGDVLLDLVLGRNIDIL